LIRPESLQAEALRRAERVSHGLLQLIQAVEEIAANTNQDFDRRRLHLGEPLGQRLRERFAVFLAFAMDEELLELIEEQHDWRPILRRGCPEQALEIGPVWRPVDERQMFEAGPFGRFEGVEVAEFDVDAAKPPSLQLRPQSGLQKRRLAHARFAAQR